METGHINKHVFDMFCVPSKGLRSDQELLMEVRKDLGLLEDESWTVEWGGLA